MQEPKPLGTGGGLYLYRHEILRGGPKHIFVIYGDVGCSYPFDRLLRAHQEAPSIRATILATQVPREYATNYGCIVREPGTNIIQHYVEKPATFVSDFVSCGVFLLEASVLEGLPAEMPEASPSLLPPQQRVSGVRPRMIGLEQDILAPLAASRKVAAYETKDFWCQVKTASSAITANRLYLEDICFRYPERLAAGDKNGWSCEIIGAVWIDPTAVVHPDAKIGPNVSIGPGCEIGEGVRIRDSIVLDASQVGANSAILNSVVGWESRVGAWCRIEGAPDGAACETVTLNGIKMPSITILGGFVDVADEAIIRNCIVLPNKDLTKSYQNEILL